MNVLYLFIILASLLSRVPQSLAADQNTRLAKPLIEEGIGNYQKGDYDGAIRALTQAHQLLPDHSPTVLYLGLAYLKENRLQEAISTWQTYVTLPPYTATERQNDLQNKVNQYLTILLRTEGRQQARAAIAREREIGPGDPNTVAITYYRNLGSPDLTALQKGLTALLIVDVSQVKELRVVERDRLQALVDEQGLGASGLVDQATAARTGHLLGAGRVATGSYIDPTRQQMRLDSVLANTTSTQMIRTEQANGQLLQFYMIEKQLSVQILNDLGYDQSRLQANGVLDRIRRPQTTSYAAFESYSRGLDAKDRQDYGAARSLFKKALTADPGFEEARRELQHTPLALLSLTDIENSVDAAAPSAGEATAGMPGTLPVSAPPNPVTAMPPPPVPPAIIHFIPSRG